MSKQINELLLEYSLGIKKIYGKALKTVILYGSYARNDFNDNSDQDIMILVSLSEEQIVQTRESVSKFTYEFNMQYDMEIVPLVKSEEHFNYWQAVYPLYININKDGVKIYET